MRKAKFDRYTDDYFFKYRLEKKEEEEFVTEGSKEQIIGEIRLIRFGLINNISKDIIKKA